MPRIYTRAGTYPKEPNVRPIDTDQGQQWAVYIGNEWAATFADQGDANGCARRLAEATAADMDGIAEFIRDHATRWAGEGKSE